MGEEGKGGGECWGPRIVRARTREANSRIDRGPPLVFKSNTLRVSTFINVYYHSMDNESPINYHAINGRAGRKCDRGVGFPQPGLHTFFTNIFPFFDPSFLFEKSEREITGTVIKSLLLTRERNYPRTLTRERKRFAIRRISVCDRPTAHHCQPA